MKWFYPKLVGWIEANFDVAIRPHVTVTAIGRNKFGDILFARSNLSLPIDLTLGETLTTFQVMNLAIYHKYSYVLCEGDFDGVIEALQNINLSPPWFFASFL